MLNGGTTTAALAKLLKELRGPHVITDNLMAVPLLRDLPEGDVTLLGGDLPPSCMSTFNSTGLINHLGAIMHSMVLTHHLVLY